MKRYTSILSTSILLACFAPTSYASELTTSELIKTVERLCKAPKEKKSSIRKIERGGSLGFKFKSMIFEGEIEISKGTANTIKHKEKASYRDCVKSIIPILMKANK